MNRFEGVNDLQHEIHEVASGDVTLHVETLESNEPSVNSRSIVLLSEAEAPSSRWPDDLLAGLARRFGRCCWFDTRDVGASTWTEAPYGIGDLVADARAVIETLQLEPVDLFGRSMGGEITMRLALTIPDEVRSLVLLSTTPGRRDELGLPEQWLIQKMADRLLGGVPVDDESRVQWIVDQWDWFSGPVFPFDRGAAIERAQRELREGWRGPNGHGQAVMEADDIVDDLASLTAPSLIIHGTADPVLPLHHARALDVTIENSTLKMVEGLGHELPEGFVEQLLGYIEDHLTG